MSSDPLQRFRPAGRFDRRRLEEQASKALAREGRFHAPALPAMLDLVAVLEADPRVQDLRWIAYILATVYWETTRPTSVTRQLFDKKGKALLDKKGQPRFVKTTPWKMTFQPVREVGLGAKKEYFQPVKVFALPGGSVRITEQDGDQFVYRKSGYFDRVNDAARMGTKPDGPVAKVYDEDKGTPHVYYGRGHSQLTWWDNYARAGFVIDRGFDLLLDPDLALDPDISLRILLLGMLEGKGFAGKRKLSDYLDGAKSDYVAARAIVNGKDHPKDIARIARLFEEALLGARIEDGPR
jgi:hypothetical protein